MKIGIVGTGLIGASIGMGLKAKGHTILGFDQSEEHLEIAKRRHAIDQIETLEGTSQADIVFVCVPPAFTVPCLKEIVKVKGRETLVTDTSSIKAEVAEWGKDVPQFIAGHPMAGHEKGGPTFASNWLFRGAKWIICPPTPADESNLARLEGVIKQLDAVPVRMAAEEHDRHAAILSHLPHVLAALLLECGATLESTDASGGSWKDLTRVGGVDPDLWSQILLGNRKEVSATLKSLSARINEISEQLDAKNEKQITKWLKEVVKLKGKQK